MTKNKDVYNVSFSGSPKWYNSTDTFGFEEQTTPGYVKKNKEARSLTEEQSEDLFMQAVKQQHEAVLESERQYYARIKENRAKYAKGEKIFPDSVVRAIRQELLERAGKGFVKYNETLDRTDLSLVEWLQHAKEEAMDMVLYLERAIQEIKYKKD